MGLTIDHVAFAGRELDALRRATDAVGLSTDYGGEHAAGTTHMALVGFDDGSYLELVASVPEVEPAAADFWPAHVAADAGPAGWCIAVDDVAAAAKRAIDAGVPVDGPHAGGRERPDGTRVEWDVAFEGTDEVLPFVIRDRTPRSYRVSPTDGVAGGPLTGVETVVVAVPDRDTAAGTFARRHRFPTPVPAGGSFEFGGDLATVPGQPVVLAAPSEGAAGDGRDERSGGGGGLREGRAGSLADRLEQVGPGPCAYLLGTRDLDAAREAYDLAGSGRLGERRVAWFDADPFRGRLGVVETR